jgi:hypothetical protein
VVEAVGPAAITSSGSGTTKDYTYSIGFAKFTDSTVVQGSGTQWLTYAKAGQIIRANADLSKEYRITSVYSDTMLYISTHSNRLDTGSPSTPYTIVGKDSAYFNDRNIIDRLPAYDARNDSSGANDAISTATSDPYPVIETHAVSKVQDIEGIPANTAIVGVNNNASGRGRSEVNLPADKAPLGFNNLGLKFEKLSVGSSYKKSYQSYLYNKDDSGRLYMMVVGSETDNNGTSTFLNPYSNLDSVDLFELPGRPVIANRRS